MTSISRLLQRFGAQGATDNARAWLAEYEDVQRQADAIARRFDRARTGSRRTVGNPPVRKSA